MKRIQYDRYGGAEELKLSNVEIQAPRNGQVQVRVMAASVNPMDWVIRRGEVKIMTGSRFPRGLGHDFAGVIEAVGSDVRDLKVGDKVFGATSLKEAGAFAEVLITDEKNAVVKPPELAFEVAAALPIVGITAWTGLVDKAKIRAGQSILVTGCLGGVGRAAVQLALLRGATVAGSCSGSGRQEALALGVTQVFDYRLGALNGHFDVVFDTAGALSFAECEAILKPRGVAIHIVNTPGKMIRSLLSPQHYSVVGALTPESMEGITDAALKGKLVPKIAQTVSLEEAIPAIIGLEKSRLPKGKVVVIMQ